jgi:hypothetical protein
MYQGVHSFAFFIVFLALLAADERRSISRDQRRISSSNFEKRSVIDQGINSLAFFCVFLDLLAAHDLKVNRRCWLISHSFLVN